MEGRFQRKRKREKEWREVREKKAKKRNRINIYIYNIKRYDNNKSMSIVYR